MTLTEPRPISLPDGPALFIPKTHAEGRKHCCPLCDGFGTVRRLTIAHIVRVVCEQRNVAVEDMLSARRDHEVAHPRQEAMYLARQLTPQSLTCIGRKFDRDHTTVLHAIREIEKRMSCDLAYEREIEGLMMEMMAA